LKITECLWIDKFVDKIIGKHNVFPEEVEEVLSNQPLILKLKKEMLKEKICTLHSEKLMEVVI
jgi:hypothetical protein